MNRSPSQNDIIPEAAVPSPSNGRRERPGAWVRRLRLASALLAVLSVLHGPATAQWKWVDAEGRVNYSDLPPPDGGTGTPVRISPLQSSPPDRSDAPGTDAAAGDAGRASVAERAAEFAERQRAREKAQRAEAQRERALAARARSCELLRGSLRTLESGARIAEVDADGQRRLLDADERARRISETRTTLAAQCGSL